MCCDTDNDALILETPICDLANVAGITRHIVQGLLESPNVEDETGVHFTMSKDEWDRAFFLLGDVAHRAKEVKAAYYRALAVEMER